MVILPPLARLCPQAVTTFVFVQKNESRRSQYAERDLNKTSNTLTETLTELFLMA